LADTTIVCQVALCCQIQPTTNVRYINYTCLLTFLLTCFLRLHCSAHSYLNSLSMSWKQPRFETEPRFQSADDPSIDASSSMTSSSNVNRPHRTSAGIGESCLLDCHVRYPKEGVYVQHIVTWRKQGIEAPIYLLFDGYPPRLDPSFQGRLRAVGPASIEMSDIRVSDEGWYECTVLFMDHQEEQTDNGTWIYLAVNGKVISSQSLCLRVNTSCTMTTD